MGFVQGESRQQAALLPVCIEDLLPAEYLVRVIDAPYMTAKWFIAAFQA